MFSWEAKKGGSVLFTHIKGEIAKGKVQSSNVKLSLSFCKSLRPQYPPWSNLQAPSAMTLFSFSNFFKLSLFLSLPSLTPWPLSLNLGAGKSQWWWISTSTRWDIVQTKFLHFLLVNIAENPENISCMFWLEIQKLFPVCFCQYCWDPR